MREHTGGGSGFIVSPGGLVESAQNLTPGRRNLGTGAIKPGMQWPQTVK